MSNLTVIMFDNADEAGKILGTMRSAQKSGFISLDDSAVVVKDAEGKIHIKNEMDRGVKVGVIGGGLLGLLLASVFFPVGGLLIGAAAGGLIGKSVGIGIDQKFVKEVGEELKPDTSAIFLITRDANPNVALAALKPYKGKILQTTLAPEDEAEVRRLLDKRI